jgi:hypothetical protein
VLIGHTFDPTATIRAIVIVVVFVAYPAIGFAETIRIVEQDRLSLLEAIR